MKRNIFDYLPSVYEELCESREILTVQQAEFERLNASIDDTLTQFFLDTATWGLAYWERIVDVEVDESKPIAERRSVIKARLRGAGVVTKSHIKDVAESWYGGETEVHEVPSEYKITVKFTSNYGTPHNLVDVENALRSIIPAHLGIVFEFKFLLIREVSTMTLSDLNNTPLNKFAGGA